MIRRFLIVLWKEWKSLQPFYFLLLALFIFGLVFVQIVEYMDEYPIWDNVISTPNDALIVTFILCLIGVLGVLTREKDEGVLTYLDGLPVSRLSMYCAKGFIVFVMVSALDIAWILEGLIYEHLSRESDSPATPWNHIGTFLFLNTFLVAFFVAVLLPVSFLRFWSLLVISAWFFIIAILKTQSVPYITWIDPFELMQVPDEIDEKWVIPWKHLGVLSVIGIFSWFIGLCFYSMMSAISGRKAREFVGSFWGKALAAIGVMASLIFLLVLFFILSSILYEKGELPEEVRPIAGTDIRPEIEGGNAIETATSKKFEFVYRKKMRKRARQLLKESDEIFFQVADYLQADDAAKAGRTVVDFSNPLGSHNAGQAYWKKIRMAYPANWSLEEAKAVLGHEVTHVLINNITGKRLEESFGSARWFHEGLASQVEFEIFRPGKAATDYEHWLALSSTWGEVHFSELVLNGVLVTKRDPNIAYPAGMEWIRAAIDVYGEEFPAKILKSIDRPDAPRELAGLALWRDACLAAGYDLERIRGRFRVRLRDLRTKFKETCEKMPEITEGEAKRVDGQIIITPELPDGWKDNAPEGAKLICRVRPDKSGDPGRWRYSQLGDDDTFSVSEVDFLKPKIGFQIGWHYKTWCDQPVFGQWIEATPE